jgi:hypothetical protein
MMGQPSDQPKTSANSLSTGGLTPATFVPTLSLVTQWNGAQDVARIRDQVD